jgi:hypothetical protein
VEAFVETKPEETEMLDSLAEELGLLTEQTLENSRLNVPEGANSLEFLQAVYRNAEIGLHIRMKAARACLPFELPKLAVTAVVDAGADFAAKLDAACRRSANVIEARAEPQPEVETLPPPIGRSPTPLGAPMQRLRRL